MIQLSKPLLIAVGMTLLLAAICFAGPPPEIYYQGRITDDLGDPVNENDLSVRFIIYDDSTGGSILWLTVTSKEVVDGLYSHRLGSISAFPDTLFTAFDSLWLEVLVDGEAQDPRTLLAATAYAMHVVNGPGVSQNTTGGSFEVTQLAYETVYGDTCNCPAAGFVLAMANLEARAQHVNGTASLFQIGLDEQLNDLGGDQDQDWHLVAGQPSGTHRVILSFQKIFPCEKGPRPVYVNARRIDSDSPSLHLQDITISLIYFPVAYGGFQSVSPPLPD